MIYHYTTIESLEAILNSGSIKFNKLTNMDDMAEFESFKGPFNPKEYIFVTSWSKDSQENITLWNCYTNNKIGVRIELEDMPFPLFFPSHPRLKLKDNFAIDEVPLFLLPFDDAFTRGYFVLSFYYVKEDFEKQVMYLSDEELNAKYFAYAIKSYDSNTNSINTHSGELASWKSKTWESQKEFRFVLMIFPQDQEHFNPNSNTFTRDYIAGLLKNSIEFYLLKLRKDALANMKIVLSPYADESDSKRVMAILNRFKIPLSQYSRSTLRIQYRK
jgi:hypothetical protein